MNKGTEALIASIKPDLKLAKDKSLPHSVSFPAIDRLSDVLTLDVLSELIAALEQAQQRIDELEAERKMVMFIDGDISPSDAEKLVAVIRDWDAEENKPFPFLEASPLAVKLPAHKYRECVNGLLEEAIAYAGTQQLRARLSSRLANFVQADHPHTRCAGGQVEGK